jgi:uracil-DNA glycosylase
LPNWRAYGENSFVLPHPSWRNTAWIKRNPWFETELIPALQARIGQIRKTAYDPA